MTEADSDFFFGRGRETIEVLSALASAADRLPVLIGNSGVGKSSLAQAGVLAALKRQAWPEEAGRTNAWPQLFRTAAAGASSSSGPAPNRSRRWSKHSSIHGNSMQPIPSG